MFIRIKFTPQQVISAEELRELESTLSDKVEFTQMVKEPDGDIVSFSSWSHTYDPNDPCFKKEDNRKVLIEEVDQFRLSDSREYFTDLELFVTKHPNIKFEMRGLPKSVEKDYSTVIQSIVAVQEKFETALKRFDRTVEFNERCDIHISNMGILNINEVAILEDSCTDELQAVLDKGWRIVTVNPQPNQRRSDYVLGRYNPDRDISKAGAVRL